MRQCGHGRGPFVCEANYARRGQPRGRALQTHTRGPCGVARGGRIAPATQYRGQTPEERAIACASSRAGGGDRLEKAPPHAAGVDDCRRWPAQESPLAGQKLRFSLRDPRIPPGSTIVNPLNRQPLVDSGLRLLFASREPRGARPLSTLGRARAERVNRGCYARDCVLPGNASLRAHAPGAAAFRLATLPTRPGRMITAGAPRGAPPRTLEQPPDVAPRPPGWIG